MDTVSWTPKPGDVYIVTGTDVHGRRFRVRCTSWAQAEGINVWRGTKWLLRNGRRRKIQSIWN